MNSIDGLERNFTLNSEDYLDAVAFAIGMYFSEKSRTDWRGATNRGIGKYISDHAPGKLAEKAFAKFLSQFGLSAEMDFEIYPGREKTDEGGDLKELQSTSGDLVQLKKTCDVKQIKFGSKYLMLQAKEFHNREYDYYILVLINLPNEHLLHFLSENLNTLLKRITINKEYKENLENEITLATGDILDRIYGRVVGWVDLESFKKNAVFYESGEELPSPWGGTKPLINNLRNDNYTLPIDDLNKSHESWIELIEKLTKNKLPIDDDE